MSSESINTCKENLCGQCCTRLTNVGVKLGGNIILKEINLHIHCGHFTAIVGPNGAGKSTLFKAILGELPFTGTIQKELPHIQEKRDTIIGYVPQKLDFDTASPVSVLDLFSASLSRKPVWMGYSKCVKRQTQKALEMFNAGNLLHSRLGTLSGGQLQRVLLALALTPVPDLLLLDEPVSGVDLANIDLFYDMVSRLRRTHHLAILLVSHDIPTVAKYADRLIFLNQQILCVGSPGDVLENELFKNTFGHFKAPEIRGSSSGRLTDENPEGGS